MPIVILASAVAVALGAWIGRSAAHWYINRLRQQNP